ncbi:MAG: IclR family transcriptional regulator [Nocardioidaceae bacterium]
MATSAHPPAVPARRNTSGLTRDLEILELLAGPQALRAGGLRVLRIAELLGRDKATVSRALATLADTGVLDRDPDRLTYHLGSRLYALAARTREAALVQRARPLLRQVVQSLRETTHLCVLRGGNVLTLVSELSPREVATAGWAGTTTAAWRTPSGKVLISDWDRASVDSWYTVYGDDEALVNPRESRSAAAFSVLVEPRPDHVGDLDSLHAELDRIRRQGYATSDEELEHGVVAASAPVRDATGAVVASLNVSAPKSRVGRRLEDLGVYVAQYGAALSAEIGGPSDDDSRS